MQIFYDCVNEIELNWIKLGNFANFKVLFPAVVLMDIG